MKPNKSIDGLTTRSAKNTKKTAPKLAAKSSVKKSTGIVEPLPEHHEKNIEIEEIDSELVDTTESIEVKTAESEPNTKVKAEIHEQTVEDFLKPVQAFDFDDETGELKESTVKTDKKKEESKKSHKEKKKPSKARRIISIIALVIVLILIGGVLWAVFWGNDIIAKITGGQGNVLDLLTFTNETYDPLKEDTNGRTNILAFGTSGYNMDGEEGNGVHDGAQLTDSIMLISLDQKTGDVAMLSLPRDLKASPTCTATGKINEVYWCNDMYGEDEVAGATALMSEVGTILGVDIQYYAHVNWGSLVQIVDTLGGITVTLDEDIYDYYTFEAGVPYTLNGEQALALSRSRHGTVGGDFSRSASQQKILIGIKDRIIEKGLSLPDMLSLASALGDNLRTNFSLNELKTLAHLLYTTDFESMRQVSLYDPMNGIYYMTTGTINGISYVLPAAGVGNYAAIQEYVANQLSSDPRKYEEPTILVLNASETPGVAASERDKLVAEGYTITAIDNTPEGEYEEGTRFYALTNKPGTKNLLELYYKLDARPASELPAGIPTDYDFVIIVNPKPEVEAQQN